MRIEAARFFVIATLAVAGFSLGCSGRDQSHWALEGIAQFADDQPAEPVRLFRAFVNPDPLPEAPGQTRIVATDLDIDCEGYLAGDLEATYPRVNLGLTFSDNQPGTYTLLGGSGGNPDLEMGGLLFRATRVNEITDFAYLPIGGGYARVLSVTQGEWDLEVSLSLVRGADRLPAGEVTGRIKATFCGAEPE